MLIDALEWAGSLLGLLGAFLLATHTRISRYGWRAGFFRIRPLWKCDWITAATRVSVVVMVVLLLFVGFFAVNSEPACGLWFHGSIFEPIWKFGVEPIHCDGGA